jgi:hypothetical protein
MYKVVAKRLEARGHVVDDIIAPRALEMLARTSGGVMRELIRYFRNAAEFAQLLEEMHIDEEIARNVVNQQRQDITLPDWDVLASMRRSYLEGLVARHGIVDFQGLSPMRGGQVVQMRMEDIFVPLRTEQEVKFFATHPSSGSESSTLLRRGSRQHFVPVEPFTHASGETGPLPDRAPFPRTALHEVSSRRVEISEVLQARRAVVLGDPGAGKTTFLRYVAYTLAKSRLTGSQSGILQAVPELNNFLPVYVRIGEYAQHLREKAELTPDAFAPISSQREQLPLTDDLVKDAIAEERALFLLDGLDEVIDTSQRRDVWPTTCA